MPIFQYDQYRNPYGPSIAEALQHANDPAAQAALRVGDLQAQGAERTAALQGQLWTQLGSIPAQIQASQEAAQKLALQRQQAQLVGQQIQEGQLQLTQAQKDAKSRNIFEAEIQNPANYNPDGTPNDDRITQALRTQDVGAWQKYQQLAQSTQAAALNRYKTLADIAKSNAEAGEKQAQARKAQQDYLGQTALAAYTGLQQNPDDPLHARDWALAFANKSAAEGAVSPAAAQAWTMRLASANPDQVGAAFLSVVPPEMKAKYDKDLAEANKPIDVAAGGTLVAPPKPGQPAAVVFTAPPKDTVPKAYEKSAVLLDGKPAEVLLDPTPGGKIYDLSGVPIDQAAARIRPLPPAAIQVLNAQTAAPVVAVDASRPTGPAANLPDKLTGQTPNAIYQGALAFALQGVMPPQGRGTDPRSKATRDAMQNKAAALADAAGVDLPTVRAEYRANAGTLAKLLPQVTATASAANTATDNLDLALQQSDVVGRPDARLANRYLQWAQGNLTDATGLSKFETYVYTAAREYAKVTSGGAASAAGLSDTAAREASHLLSTTMSPSAFAASVEAMKNDMANVQKRQTESLAGVSHTIANFLATAHGLPVPDSTPAPATPPASVAPAGPVNPFRR
jgi:O6-methylguanine-DNA--protein-cysteine methyltransferase